MSLGAQRCAVPVGIDDFVDQGFLEVLTERPDERTVEFHIASRVNIDHRRRITAYAWYERVIKVFGAPWLEIIDGTGAVSTPSAKLLRNHRFRVD
jgi:hypothetical protein